MSWISVKEALPEPWVWVLVWHQRRENTGRYRIGRLGPDRSDWRGQDGENIDFVGLHSEPMEVTHWCPLPKALGMIPV